MGDEAKNDARSFASISTLKLTDIVVYAVLTAEPDQPRARGKGHASLARQIRQTGRRFFRARDGAVLLLALPAAVDGTNEEHRRYDRE